MQMVIGTYNKEIRKNGVYVLDYDAAKHEMQRIAADSSCINPSFLCQVLGDDGSRYLYAVNERECGAVSAYQLTEKGELKFLNSLSAGGSGSCHLEIDRARKMLYVANYSQGSLFCCTILADGTLGEVKQTLYMEGSGTDQERQECAHMHCITLSPDGCYLFAADLGTDRIYQFVIQPDGTLSPNQAAPFLEIDGGEGPRHLVFSASGKTGYLVTELGNHIYTLDYDCETGCFTIREKMALLSEGVSLAQTVNAAELLRSPNGNYLYVSTRFYDRIMQFEILPDEGLRKLEEFSCYGKTPRHFSIAPKGNYMAIANQDSNQVVICELDNDTGKIGSELFSYSVELPVCVLF